MYVCIVTGLTAPAVGDSVSEKMAAMEIVAEHRTYLIAQKSRQALYGGQCNNAGRHANLVTRKNYKLKLITMLEQSSRKIWSRPLSEKG